MRTYLATAGACAGVLATGAARAQSDEAKRFGAREEVSQVSLSPDGAKFAAIVNLPGRGQRVMVGSTTGADAPVRPVASASGDPEHVNYCQFASDTRLVCDIGTVVG